ncbi:hypothetical protein [Novosphingobium jiangmenense]|uniref:Uncharacterized protein n=1 Tax=Novosphingobium jiangmenense TaxID=2791981 RepID=A0ABS0HDI4_9SPHN|nr:hypothetical protein [Novosphingobium jiangmenense]MBF9150282.1 hypothetical protein [Novosphingobium jiangmenense]
MPSLLPLMLAATSSPEAVQLSLNCSALNPQAQHKSIQIDLDERGAGRILVRYSIDGEKVLVADKVAETARFVEREGMDRNYVINDPREPLGMTLINRGDEWAVDLYPASWKAAYGPLITGRCIHAQRTDVPMSQLVSTTDLPIVVPLLGPVSPGVRWPSVAYSATCQVTDGRDEQTIPLTVSVNGDLKFGSFEGSMHGGLGLRAGGMTVVHNKLTKDLPNGEQEVLTIVVRQSEFWVDWTKGATGGAKSWFRGVCAEWKQEEAQ